MKIGFQTIVWGPMVKNLGYMLDVIAAAGYKGVEFMQRPEVLGDIDRILKLLEERDLMFIGLCGGTLTERIEFCGDFRPEYLYVDTWNRKEAREAMNAGFTLGLHPHAYMPVGRLDEAQAILNEYPKNKYPRLKFIPDTAHLTVTHDDVIKAIRVNKERIIAVHLKDWSPEFGRSSYRYARGFTELGNGCVKLDDTLAELTKNNYDGWLVVEQDYTIARATTNTIESAKWLANKGFLAHPPEKEKIADFVGLQGSENKRPVPSKKKEAIFLRLLRRMRLQNVDLWYKTIARCFGRLISCKLVEVWTCSPAHDTMNFVAIEPDPLISLKAFTPECEKYLSGITMKCKKITEFDLTDSKNAERFEHAELISKLNLKKMISVPVFNPWNFNHVRVIVNLFPRDEETLISNNELFRFAEYVAFTLDSALEDICFSSANKASFLVSKCEGVKDFLDSLIELIKGTITCEDIAIFLMDDAGDKLELKASTKGICNVSENEQFYKEGEGLRGRVLKGKETLLVAGAHLGGKLSGEDSCLLMPLIEPTFEVAGIIQCRNKSTPRFSGKPDILLFSDEDAAILESIGQAAVPQLDLLYAQEEREKAFLDIKTSLRVLGHEAEQLNFGIESIRVRYLDDVRKLKRLKELEAGWLCRDIYGYFKLLDFLFKHVRMATQELPELNKELFWVYEELLFKWSAIYRLEAMHRNLKFDIFKPTKTNPEYPRVYADKTLLELLIYNLVGNAVKYCHQGTQIKIECKKEDVSQKRSPQVLKVTNYGRQFKCAKPFELAKRGDNVWGIEGTGIGLYNAQRIAKAHDSTIEIECDKISDFNILIIKPYINSVFEGKDEDMVERLERELNKLKKSGEYDEIIATSNWELRLYNLTKHELIDYIKESTYKVTFKMEIPAK